MLQCQWGNLNYRLEPTVRGAQGTLWQASMYMTAAAGRSRVRNACPGLSAFYISRESGFLQEMPKFFISLKCF